MKKSVKITLLVAASLVLVGLITVVTAFALGGRFDMDNTHEVTHSVEDAFDSVIVSVGEADVYIKPSPTGACYAVCDESDRLRYTLVVEDGNLILGYAEDRRWYDFLTISTGRAKRITLYLPAGEYRFLDIRTGSGDIVSADPTLSFGTVGLSSGSGDIRFSSPTPLACGASTGSGDIEVSGIETGTMMLHTSSGNLSLRNSVISRDLTAKSSSGDISLETCTAAEFTLTNGSGEIELQDVIASGKLTVKTSSGDIDLSRCDATELTLSAGSGHIEGTLLSDKLFDVRSSSGRVRYPASIKGGDPCTAHTSSGDIELSILSSD